MFIKKIGSFKLIKINKIQKNVMFIDLHYVFHHLSLLAKPYVGWPINNFINVSVRSSLQIRTLIGDTYLLVNYTS